MLEWLTSKVVVSIAAMVILASVGGFLIVQKGTWEDEELGQVSKRIAGYINDISNINAQTTVIIWFEGGGKGLRIPDQVGGETYSINLYRDMVSCFQGETSRKAFFFRNVHLFPPFSMDLSNITEVRGQDLLINRIWSESNGSMVVMREVVGGQLNGTFETFVFFGD